MHWARTCGDSGQASRSWRARPARRSAPGGGVGGTRHWRDLLVAVAALLVAVAAGATAAAIQQSRANKKLETSLYFHRIALAHRELSADNLGRALGLLDECPKDLRQWEWDYINRLCRVEPLVLHDPGSREVTSVAFSPDGERIAAAGGDGTVKVWNCRTRKVVRILDAQAHNVFSVAFHPGGKYLASAGANREVRVWDLTTGTTVFTCPGYTGAYFGTAYGVAFSPDGRRLAAGSDGAVNIWDWGSGQLLHSLPGHEKRGICVAFSRDGRRLATGSWSGDVMICNAARPRSAAAAAPVYRNLHDRPRLRVLRYANLHRERRTTDCLTAHGNLVYSADREALRLVPILRVNKTAVSRHHVIELTLANGAVLRMSAGHPTSGRPLHRRPACSGSSRRRGRPLAS